MSSHSHSAQALEEGQRGGPRITQPLRPATISAEAAIASEKVPLEAAGRTVTLSSPAKVVFPERGWTKLDLANHYLLCVEGAFRGVRARPCMLKRWPRGVSAPPFFQKRAPKGAPTTEVLRQATEKPVPMFTPAEPADVLAMVQLGCVDLNPWTIRRGHLDHPDELRLDLDPTDDTPYDAVREVAALCRTVLEEVALTGWPKTSGSRGMHVYVRVEPRWDFLEVRRAGLALAREVERRAPGVATMEWWKEERRGVFIDYNQNARDRSIASAYSVRQTGRVSTPFRWDELGTIDPLAYDLGSFADRWAAVGDLTEGIDEAAGSLEGLLRLATLDDERGLADAPWPPHYPKQPGEPPRVNPSRRRSDA